MTREFVTLFFVLVLLTVNNEVEGARDYFLLKMTHRPWKEDPTCSAHQIGFITNHTYPLMALVSYPGSGNTWIRQLIEGLTGFFTGSVYEDMDIFLKGLYGEKMDTDCRCTIVQKTHDYLPESGSKKTNFHGNGVLILRNPYKAIISLRNYEANLFDHLSVASNAHFDGPEWDRFVTNELQNWRKVALKWISSIRKGGVIHYEKLLVGREQQLRKLMQLLRLDVDDGRLQCVLRHDPMTFKRHSSKSFNPYTNEQQERINEVILEVQQALQHREFDQMPLELYEIFNGTRASLH